MRVFSNIWHEISVRDHHSCIGRRKLNAMTASLLTLTMAVTSVSPVLAQAHFSQQGPKIVGAGAVGAAQQGSAVAFSADGNTMIVGGLSDNGNVGAAWVFTRSAGVWSQQGSKLVGTGSIGGARQGVAVAMSADGNTALVGGHIDNNSSGATWVFVRNNGVWTQQGPKLIGTGAPSGATQGYALRLSADGNTAIVGNYFGDLAGGAFIFTRSNGVWTQQGARLVGTGAVPGNVVQGYAVALSGDGNTAIIGAPYDNNEFGAVWFFTRSGNTWSQQGGKVIGTGAVGGARQGASVSLSADGNTAIFGGEFDNDRIGASWVFVRSAGVWGQQGNKLVGSASSGIVYGGYAVGLSADGNSAVVSGRNADNGIGAGWVFTRSGSTWTETDRLVGSDASGTSGQGYAAAISSDGSTLALGGVFDAANVGATWVFARSSSLLSAVLPTSRSVRVGTAATAFASVINIGSVGITACGLSLGTAIPATFQFQTTNPQTNAATGSPNTPVNIAAGGLQTYVFAITPSAALQPTDVLITASCSDSGPAPTVVGLNTLLLSASATPIPDIFAIAATPSNDGVVNVPGSSGSQAFAVAAYNAGISAPITVSADTGALALPLTITICETNPSTAQCTSPIASTVTTTIAANATPTFSAFVQATGAVTPDYATKRIFLRFKDADGIVRGATSVAVRTTGQDAAPLTSPSLPAPTAAGPASRGASARATAGSAAPDRRRATAPE